MDMTVVKLIDAAGNVWAVAQVAEDGDHFGGGIDLAGVPTDVRSLFDEFEEIVNGQMLSFLDEIQTKIAALPIKAALANGQEMAIKDLQVFPSTGDISFKLAEIPVLSRRPA